MGKGNYSLKDVYSLVGDTRKELLERVDRLDDKFMRFEEGRVSSLEKAVSNIQGRMIGYASLAALIVSILVAIISKFIQ